MTAFFKVHPLMLIDFYPTESHLVTFRDKSSFPLLYHPACNDLVPAHIASLAQKVRTQRGNVQAGKRSLV